MEGESLIIIPTYNEAHNILRIIEDLLALDEPADILIIDDNSPDGTGQIVEDALQRDDDRIHLIQRSNKQGLGTAYVQGFRYALENDYTFICEMDADFSHNPADLPRLIETVRSGRADVAVGSRYKNGISIVNWPLTRLIISYTANVYAKQSQVCHYSILPPVLNVCIATYWRLFRSTE